mmetsp:Transcript_10702/g.33293  ORF Transcript_10702/g.33293 Transcript_10702/m.33293 type:complete len:325 (+) Transcript_10702:1880-2854(+)
MHLWRCARAVGLYLASQPSQIHPRLSTVAVDNSWSRCPCGHMASVEHWMPGKATGCSLDACGTSTRTPDSRRLNEEGEGGTLLQQLTLAQSLASPNVGDELCVLRRTTGSISGGPSPHIWGSPRPARAGTAQPLSERRGAGSPGLSSAACVAIALSSAHRSVAFSCCRQPAAPSDAAAGAAVPSITCSASSALIKRSRSRKPSLSSRAQRSRSSSMRASRALTASQGLQVMGVPGSEESLLLTASEISESEQGAAFRMFVLRCHLAAAGPVSADSLAGAGVCNLVRAATAGVPGALAPRGQGMRGLEPMPHSPWPLLSSAGPSS